MTTRTKWLAGVLLAFTVAVMAQSYPGNEQARDLAAAARAARLDAMRQLAESVKGLRISAETTVRDFVTEKDEINGSLDVLLEGAQQVGDPVYHPDGTCEVTMQISMDQLISGLGQIAERCDSETIPDPSQFQDIRRYHPQVRVFTATGSGAMKEAPTPIYDDLWKYVTPQGKLLAVRAAKVDAYRNMGETIKGVRLTSGTTVRDFVTVSDEIRSAFDGIVRGVEFIGQPRYKPEGIVEVTAQVDVNKLIYGLSGICQQHYRGRQWNSQSFEAIRRFSSSPIIRATGVGVPPAQHIRKPTTPDPYPPFPNPNPNPTPVKPYVPEWANRTVRVTGNGTFTEAQARNPGQAKLLARRAAQMDAYRLLAEQVIGLRIDAGTTVQDFVAQSDEVSGRVEAFLKGARIVETRDMPDGAEVDLELYLGDMWQIIQEYQTRNR